MKIELTEADVENGLHNGAHSEMWVRVLSDTPMGPAEWDTKVKPLVDAELRKQYRTDQCQFLADTWDTDDPERKQWGFEQYYIFPKIKETA